MARLDRIPLFLQEWSNSVSSGDISSVVERYADNGVLKGTLYKGFVIKDDPQVDFEGEGRVIEDYFEFLSQGKKNLHVQWENIRKQAEGLYAADYTFVWDDAITGERRYLRADATFAFDAEGKIVLHHSSPATEQSQTS